MSDSKVTDISTFRSKKQPEAAASFDQAAAEAKIETPAPESDEPVEGPLYSIMLAHMQAQNPNMIQYFRESMRELVSELNLDTALAQQKGHHEGTKLKTGAKAEFDETMFAFWMYIEPPLWDAIMQSYEDDVWTYDSDKFTNICESVSPDALDHFLNTAQHKNPKAIRKAFENSLMAAMEPLHILTSMIAQHIPGVEIKPSIHHGIDFVTPVITLKSKDGKDLREHLKPFLEQTKAGTGPILRPV